MRVLQLIDSLHPGGAERVAVNIANALVSNVEVSYLCATRAEGLLKETINAQVNYLFLDKSKTVDTQAIKRLSAFVKKENINIIHAHGTSFFLATIIKILNTTVKIVWHDHYGDRANTSKRNQLILKQCSKSFSQIFCVNENLVNWATLNLKCSKINFLPNFVIAQVFNKKTQLKGKEGKRIICLANLRPDKDHFNAIAAFKKIVITNPEWTMHFVGKTFNGAYLKSIIDKVNALGLSENIFFYGSIGDVPYALEQSTIGILSSASEGLPMALLEYGLRGLPVVVTNVGDCSKVILDGALGALVPSQDSDLLAGAIQNYIDKPKLALEKGTAFNAHVLKFYASKVIIDGLVKNYNSILEAK